MKNARIQLKNTPEQIELFKAAASADSVKAMNAREAIAKFIGPVLNQVLNHASYVNDLYTPWPYNEDDVPTFPLDLYYGAGVNQIVTWSQSTAGGLGTTNVCGLQEMTLSTFHLDSAVNFNVKTIKRGRLPYISLGLNRMAQELLLKIENNGFYILLQALVQARTNGLEHIIQSTGTDRIQLDDFNRLITRSKRIATSWDGGTPDVTVSQGATDIYMSPEQMEGIRAMAYNPQNVTAIPNTDESTALGLPDSIREEIFRNAGASEIYGKVLHELLELGIGKRYNTVFDTLYGAGTFTFDTANQEIVIGVNQSRQGLIRPIAQNAESGDSIVTQVDDQWPVRAGKIGWFTGIDTGFTVIDSRVLSGIIVQ